MFSFSTETARGAPQATLHGVRTLGSEEFTSNQLAGLLKVRIRHQRSLFPTPPIFPLKLDKN